VLVIDHVLTDNLCNLRCSYCPCDVTLLQRSGQQIRTRNGREGPPPESVDNFLERTVSVIGRVDNYVEAPILKLSGGELFLVPEFMRLLPMLCERFEVVQLLTNGTRLDDVIIAQLSTFQKVHLQISLDGHTYEMNRFRFTSPFSFATALDGLLRSVRAKLPVEVNTVLTVANIEGFWEFVAFLHNHVSDHTLIYPFPVRGNPGMVPSRDQVEAFCLKMPTLYAEHEVLLPPKAYMDALCEFLLHGSRRFGCSVPYAVVGSTGDGTLDACTCGPVKVLGNVLDGDGTATLGRIERDACYAEVQDPSLRPHCCDDCFTHYDIINLFVEGAITEQELARLPFFGTPKILAVLSAVKATATAAMSSCRTSTKNSSKDAERSRATGDAG
jgi:sulfatase maturation enzyme AslB (radical SAM superfamily)